MEGLTKYLCTLAKLAEESVTILCQGNYYPVPWSCVFDKEGRPYPPSPNASILIGEELDLFVQNNLIQRIIFPVVYPPVRIMKVSPSIQRQIPKEIRDAYYEGVNFYSQLIFPLELLKDEYSFSPSTDSLFALMQANVQGVRKCHAGDSNAIYTVLAIAYIEHLARRSTPMSELEQLQRILGPEYRAATRTLADLAELKSSRHSGIQWLINHNRSYDFWHEMRTFLRQLVMRAGIAELSTNMTAIFGLNEDIDDIPLSALAITFNLKIIVFSLELNRTKSAYSTTDADKDLAKIYLFREGGLFHILYSQAQLDAEAYNLDHCGLDPRPGYADLTKLCTRSQRRDVIQSKLMEDCDLARASLGKLPKFTNEVQRYIKCFMDLIERRRGFEDVSSFFHEDLVNESLEMIFQFGHLFEDIRAFPGRTTDGFVEAVLDALLQAPLQSVLSRREWFDNMSICSYCHNNKGKIIMDCRHAFCRNCIIEYVEKKLADVPLLLKANGETVEEFVCPMMSCFVRIPGAKLKAVLGDDRFAGLLLESEQALGKRFCYKCKKARSFTSFEQLCSCNDPVCLMCYCDSVRKNDGKCSCGLPLTAEASKKVTELTTQCATCFKVKSTLKEFTSVECEEHVLCEDCLAVVVQSSNRCPVCYRFFERQECLELKYILKEKKCMFCGEECRKNRLNTVCGCVICERCSVEQVKKTRDYLNCFNCHAFLPAFGTNQLHLWTDLTLQETQLDCPICLVPIQKTDEATLSCQHTYHVECLRDFLVNLIINQSHSDSEVPCPHPNCSVTTSANTIRPFVDAETFQTYYENFLRDNTTSCPRCSARIPHQDSNGGKKPTLLCTNCNFSFCVSCRCEYKANHDEKRCRFNKIERIVADTEKYAEIVQVRVIGQCPTCKHPALKGEGCDSVVCPSCKEKFCVICSVPYYLVEEHGKAWHRPACSNYHRQGPTAGRSSKCKACNLRQGLCKPPRDLRVRGRFTFDES